MVGVRRAREAASTLLREAVSSVADESRVVISSPRSLLVPCPTCLFTNSVFFSLYLTVLSIRAARLAMC